MRSSRITANFSILFVLFSSGAQAAGFPSVDCVISPYQIVDLASPVSGVIERVLVERSDFVRKGQVVAELAAGVERAAVELAKARANVEPEINVWQVNLNFDEKRKARVHSLYDRKVISDDNKEEADREAELSSLKLQQAHDLMKIRMLELDRAEEQLRQKIIRSPIDGFVVEKFRSAGEYIEDQAIVRIAQLDPLNVEAIVPIELFGKIHQGMAADVHPETMAVETRPARVTVVDRVGDAGSGTFGVRLEMPNPGYELPAGLKCDLRFVEGSFGTMSQRSSPPSPVPVREYMQEPETNAGVTAHTETAVSASSYSAPTPLKPATINTPALEPATPAPKATKDSQESNSSAAASANINSDYHPIRLARTYNQPAETAETASSVAQQLPENAADDSFTTAMNKVSRIGPITSEQDLARITGLLQREELVYQVVHQAAEQTKDYIVVSEVLTSKTARRDRMHSMKQKGISDLMPILKGDYKDRISAGIFSNHERALRRKHQLANLGFDCQIYARTKTISLSWVELQDSSVESPALTGLVRDLGQNIDLVARDMPVQ